MITNIYELGPERQNKYELVRHLPHFSQIEKAFVATLKLTQFNIKIREND